MALTFLHRSGSLTYRFNACSLALAMCLSAALGCAPRQKTAQAAPPTAAAIAIPTNRLPPGVRPVAYTLELTILPKTERFSGRTQIVVQLDAPTRLIWLHGRGLNVTSARALLGGEAVRAKYDQVNNEGVVALYFDRELPRGNATLELVYDAAFDRDLKGLYRVDAGGDAYAFTQLEAISARLAFPCFDEPSFKTPFDVWLTVASTDVAAANTEVISEEAFGELKRVHFAPTKPLPTYLVAFAVGPFDVVTAPPIAPSAVRTQPIPLRGLAVKGKGPLLQHALADATRTLGALETYFGIPYPYSKLDLVAVPDFAAGAMENAGLVTFRDWLLLIDPADMTEAQLRSSSYVMAHELAHQWFGDLVTMHFWDDIWLNEGFATWMGFRVVSELHPEQKQDLHFLGSVMGAMDSDARVTARMIRQPITSTHDIANAFDSITYSKGGAVLAMFERYLGAETFRKGVQSYLVKHAHGNASTEDLVQALSISASKDMHPPFASFLQQSGVPLLAAEVVCDGKRAELRVSQTRYLPLGTSGKPTGLWQIPMCARYESAGSVKETCTLLTEPSKVLPLEGEGCPAWLMPNAGAAGYYRFALAPADLSKLRANVHKLSVRERYAFVQALIAGFESGAITGYDLLSALPAFVGDPDRSIATAPMDVLRAMHDHVASQEQRAKVRSFARELYLPLLNRLGFAERKGESGDDKLLRADVLGFLAVVAEDAPTRRRLQRMGKQYLGNDASAALHPAAVPADLIELCVRVAAQDGDAALWDTLYTRFSQSQDAITRGRLLRALSSVRDARSEKALALALDPKLRVNEVFVPIREQLNDLRTRDAAWQWLTEHFDALVARVSTNNAGFTPSLAAGFCDAAMITRVQDFFAPRIETLGGGPRSLAGAIERLQLCVATVNAQRPSVVSFFQRR